MIMRKVNVVFVMTLRPCSCNAKFCLFCKKICQQEAISSVNDFSTYQNFLNCHQTSKMASVENIWRPTIFCQATKSLVSWQLSFVRSSYFANMTKGEKVAKTKNWWLQNFQIFCKRQCEEGLNQNLRTYQYYALCPIIPHLHAIWLGALVL